jgi:tryptophan synthase alpha subunit
MLRVMRRAEVWVPVVSATALGVAGGVKMPATSKLEKAIIGIGYPVAAASVTLVASYGVSQLHDVSGCLLLASGAALGSAFVHTMTEITAQMRNDPDSRLAAHLTASAIFDVNLLVCLVAAYRSR